jgi:hypothetical protein
MAIITKAIRLETTKQNLVQAVIAKQNDCNSRFLKVTFLDEGTVIPLESSSKVTINAERKDGESNSFFGEVNGDDTATVPLHSWMLELEGIVNCDVSIIDIDGRKLTTTTFAVMVEKAAHGADDISTNPQYDVLVNLIADVNETKVGVANAIKVAASGNPVCITDSSNLEHEIKVKLGGSEDEARGFYVEEVFNSSEMDQFDSDITESGIYVIESVFSSEDSDVTEMKFKDGKEVKTIWIEGEPFAEGDMVYVEVNGDNQIFSIMRGATVQKYGKNLFNIGATAVITQSSWSDNTNARQLKENAWYIGLSSNNYFYSNSSVVSYSFDGKSATVTSLTGGYGVAQAVKCKPKQLYHLYFEVDIQDGFQIDVGFYDKDGKWLSLVPSVNLSGNKFSTPENCYWFTVCLGTTNNKTAVFSEVQVSLLPITEYEQYKEPVTYTADENGNLSIIGNGESMTLIAEDGVTIDAEYNVDTKKYIDKKFAELAAMIVNS